ncbi:liver-expressed antimicrobial peptide 2-like [Pristis pectinata]|uniref:liver-expressed antimicrobial peptide 2-like n=1 Tax=Pristis pectinata TaxID=685728 RepID=UPI00223D1721|nr:liver-expressed antimicrobial peptide 2-like [Pristis pectinata]
MRTEQSKVLAITGILLLVCCTMVESSPVSNYRSPLAQRMKRSMLWWWIAQRPIGATCRVDSECITNYCAIQDTMAFCSLKKESQPKPTFIA